MNFASATAAFGCTVLISSSIARPPRSSSSEKASPRRPRLDNRNNRRARESRPTGVSTKRTCRTSSPEVLSKNSFTRVPLHAVPSTIATARSSIFTAGKPTCHLLRLCLIDAGKVNSASSRAPSRSPLVYIISGTGLFVAAIQASLPSKAVVSSPRSCESVVVR